MPILYALAIHNTPTYILCPLHTHLYNICEVNTEDSTKWKSTGILLKWEGLQIDHQSLLDVYVVHKCHRFTFQQMDDYPLPEFIENVVESDNAIFGNIGISDFVQSRKFLDRASRLSLFPSWIIDDDIFSIIPIIYGVTEFAQNLLQNKLIPSSLTIRAYVIPQSVRSLYDRSYVHDVDIPNIGEYIKQRGVFHFGHRLIVSISNTTADIATAVNELYSEIQFNDTSNIVLIFDRRKCTQSGTQELVIFQCADWKSFDVFKSNNFIGFDLEIGDGAMNNDHDYGNVVRAYLNYGIRQRARFYPEFMMSVFAKLFVTPSTMTEYEYIQKLYSAEYKKGWNLNLDDQRFNNIYKAITGTNHETNNYYRAKGEDEDNEQQFGFFQFVDCRFGQTHFEAFTQLMSYWESDRYDSDTVIDDILIRNTKNEEESNIEIFMKEIGRCEWMLLKKVLFLWKKIECGTKNVFNITECSHMQRLITSLKRFNENKCIINDMNMKQFNSGQIIEDFDHLVSVHDIFSRDDTVRIQRYITNEVGCLNSGDCLVVNQFRNRRLENDNHSQLTEKDDISSECAVLRQTLCGIHCYLLHRTDELYRLSSENEEAHDRFSSLKVEERSDDKKDNKNDDEPLTYDSGRSVLRWLPFGEEPLFQTLRDELTQNKDGTVSQSKYEQMAIECTEKIKTEQFSDYELRELMGLKFYSDYTKDCTNLRTAHRTTASLEMRKRYYHWARVVYRAALHQAVPIPNANGDSQNAVSSRLYHGLTKLFRCDQESPTCFGPLSTTLSREVSDRFSKMQGLRLNIQSEYQDPMRRCLGIDMRPISCFKREREILLVDQPIPILSVEAYKLDDTTSINHFLYSLKTRTTEIRDRKEFYKKIGIRYKKKWIDTIMNHQELYAETKCDSKLVIARLVDELGILEVFYRSKYFSSKFIDLIGVNENEYVSLNIDPSEIDRFTVWDPVRAQHEELLNVFEFVVKNVTKNVALELRCPKNYRFSKLQDFKISIQNHMKPSPRIKVDRFDDAIQRIQIAVPVQGVFDAPIPIKTLRIPFVSAASIRCDAVKPLQIKTLVLLLPFDESLRCGGKLNVDSTSSIFIGRVGGINASDCGLQRGSKHENRCYLKYGHFIGNTKVQNDSENGNGAGGGVIVLSSMDRIVNHGALLCEPWEECTFSGGMIRIVANGAFVNNGKVSCGKGGIIDIRCSKLVNEGLIDPIPTVRIMVGWNENAEEERMKIEVVDHRGHKNQGTQHDAICHPQRLLDGEKDTLYDSGYSKGPLNKDWIILSIDSNDHLIRRIGIRNCWCDGAVKRISIEGSADNEDYEHWMEFAEIKKGGDDLQLFPVDKASALFVQEKQWKFYRISILQNHGRSNGNRFLEFVVFGSKV